MRKLAFAGAALLALMLGGCASFWTGLQTEVNNAASFLSNSNTQIVLNDIKVGAQVVAQDTQAFACVVAAGTSIASAIESNSAFNAGASVQGTNLKINVVSQAACTSLSGILSGNVTVSSGGTVINATSGS